MSGRKAHDYTQCFLKNWVAWAGAPQSTLVDQERGLVKDFQRRNMGYWSTLHSRTGTLAKRPHRETERMAPTDLRQGQGAHLDAGPRDGLGVGIVGGTGQELPPPSTWLFPGSMALWGNTPLGGGHPGLEGWEAGIAFRDLLRGCFRAGWPGELPLLSTTDCKSLYDSVHRAGGPRAPSEKRLLVDLAALRQMVQQEVAAWGRKAGQLLVDP